MGGDTLLPNATFVGVEVLPDEFRFQGSFDGLSRRQDVEPGYCSRVHEDTLDLRQLGAEGGEDLETVLVYVAPVENLGRLHLGDLGQAGDRIALSEQGEASWNGWQGKEGGPILGDEDKGGGFELAGIPLQDWRLKVLRQGGSYSYECRAARGAAPRSGNAYVAQSLLHHRLRVEWSRYHPDSKSDVPPLGAIHAAVSATDRGTGGENHPGSRAHV